MAVVNSVALSHLCVLGAGAWAHIPEEKEERLAKFKGSWEVIIHIGYEGTHQYDLRSMCWERLRYFKGEG